MPTDPIALYTGLAGIAEEITCRKLTPTELSSLYVVSRAIVSGGSMTTVPGLRCARCGHEWMPRTPEPKWCPRCHMAVSH